MSTSPHEAAGSAAARQLLVVQGLSKQFGGLQAVADLDLDVREGEILGVIGPNGAGKSTTFNMIAGALEPSRGSLVFDGEDLTGLPAHAMAGRGIMRTFQHNKPFASMTVRENVMVGMHRRLKGSLWRVLLAGAGPTNWWRSSGAANGAMPMSTPCRSARAGCSRSRAPSPPSRG